MKKQLIEQISRNLEEFDFIKILDVNKNLFEKFDNPGDFGKHENALEELSHFSTSFTNFSDKAVEIGKRDELSIEEQETIFLNLKKLMPWRKGPFNIFGNYIDSEWQSWMKWARVEQAVSSLNGKTILDVGCGNGYYSFRMLNQNPRLIIGVEPYILNLVQFYAISNLLKQIPITVIPIGMENLPADLKRFDTVFSMGVLYHRRSPFDHLINLRQATKTGGQVVLETLVIDGKLGEILVPKDRYAKMRNVWFIPSMLTLENWLQRVSFRNIQLIDVTETTITEQRKTEWMDFESLEDFLSEDKTKTIEGLPLPKRATFIMEVQ